MERVDGVALTMARPCLCLFRPVSKLNDGWFLEWLLHNYWAEMRLCNGKQVRLIEGEERVNMKRVVQNNGHQLA